MSISCNGIWGHSALLASLANAKEPFYQGLLGVNRPSHEGVVDYFDRAIALCREAGFKGIRLRGDTDYTLTSQFDRFDGDGVKFVVGFDARENLVTRAESADEELYHALVLVHPEVPESFSVPMKPVGALPLHPKRLVED